MDTTADVWSVDDSFLLKIWKRKDLFQCLILEAYDLCVRVY